MNEAPLPSPDSKPCPNCGHAVDAAATLCPHCGAALAAASSGAGRAWSIISAIILGLIALTFGAAGACFLLFSFGGGEFSSGLGGAAFGLVLTAVGWTHPLGRDSADEINDERNFE